VIRSSSCSILPVLHRRLGNTSPPPPFSAVKFISFLFSFSFSLSFPISFSFSFQISFSFSLLLLLLLLLLSNDDFAHQSQWGFWSITFFQKQLKGNRNEIAVFHIRCDICQIINRMTRWLRTGVVINNMGWVFERKTSESSKCWARNTCWLANSWSDYCGILKYYQVGYF